MRRKILPMKNQLGMLLTTFSGTVEDVSSSSTRETLGDRV